MPHYYDRNAHLNLPPGTSDPGNRYEDEPGSDPPQHQGTTITELIELAEKAIAKRK